MHTEMWEHAAVQENLATLRRRGRARARSRGRAASRAATPAPVGSPTRPASPRPCSGCSRARHPLAGRTVVVTAGGTREAIDPVRFVGNRSSGKMGHALANVAAAPGRARRARHHRAPTGRRRASRWSRVESAEEMHDAVMARAPRADAVIMAAAVADFRPKAAVDPEDQEGRRRARDRARAHHRHPRRARPGEAARVRSSSASRPRPSDVREHAAAKLAAKRVDLIVANDVSAPDAGFEVDTNRALLLDADGTVDRDCAGHQGAAGRGGARPGRRAAGWAERRVVHLASQPTHVAWQPWRRSEVRE